ncbi:hypothetical protein ACOMHN_035295 [Nucella lapillus]
MDRPESGGQPHTSPIPTPSHVTSPANPSPEQAQNIVWDLLHLNQPGSSIQPSGPSDMQNVPAERLQTRSASFGEGLQNPGEQAPLSFFGAEASESGVQQAHVQHSPGATGSGQHFSAPTGQNSPRQGRRFGLVKVFRDMVNRFNSQFL